MAELKNTFSWSVTRSNHFFTCLRLYYFAHYGFWNGWHLDAPERVRRIYVLKFMKSLVLWAGIIVHDTIKAVLEELAKGGELPPLADVQEFARQKLREGWKQAISRDWLQDPKRNVNLAELYFGNGQSLPRETTDALKTRVYEALESFYFSQAFRDMMAAGTENWFPVDVLDSFDFEGTKVFCAPDAAYRRPDGGVVIIDWKTGGENATALRTQLGCYVIYGMNKWNVKSLQDISVYGVYLNDGGRSREHVMDEAGLSQIQKQISASIAAMQSKLRNPAENEAEEEDFPGCGEPSVCNYCSFRELCQ